MRFDDKVYNLFQVYVEKQHASWLHQSMTTLYRKLIYNSFDYFIEADKLG